MKKIFYLLILLLIIFNTYAYDISGDQIDNINDLKPSISLYFSASVNDTWNGFNSSISSFDGNLSSSIMDYASFGRHDDMIIIQSDSGNSELSVFLVGDSSRFAYVDCLCSDEGDNDIYQYCVCYDSNVKTQCESYVGDSSSLGSGVATTYYYDTNIRNGNQSAGFGLGSTPSFYATSGGIRDSDIAYPNTDDEFEVFVDCDNSDGVREWSGLTYLNIFGTNKNTQNQVSYLGDDFIVTNGKELECIDNLNFVSRINKTSTGTMRQLAPMSNGDDGFGGAFSCSSLYGGYEVGFCNSSKNQYLGYSNINNVFNYPCELNSTLIYYIDNPPLPPENLSNSTISKNHIEFYWDNLLNDTLKWVEVWINDVNVDNVTIEFYNATGLSSNTSYNISLYSVSIAGIVSDNYSYFIANTSVNIAPVLYNLTPSTQNFTALENSSVNFSVDAVDIDGDSISVISWFLNGVKKSVGSAWSWFIGLWDSGDYEVEVVVNDTYNAVTYYTWNVEVEDTFDEVSASIVSSSGFVEHFIPLYCLGDDILTKTSYDFMVSIDGGNYSNISTKQRDPYYLFDINHFSDGTTFRFKCRVFANNLYGNYSESDLFTKQDLNSFYMYLVDNEPVSFTPYEVGFNADFENDQNITIDYIWFDCNDDGLWDYAYRYNYTDITNAKERFFCANNKGKVIHRLGAILSKVGVGDWSSVGCHVSDDEDRCEVVKEYEVYLQ